jgi:hypothetical protein
MEKENMWCRPHLVELGDDDDDDLAIVGCILSSYLSNSNFFFLHSINLVTFLQFNIPLTVVLRALLSL